MTSRIFGALILTITTTAVAQPLKRDRHFVITEASNGHRVDEIFPVLAISPGRADEKPRQQPPGEKVHPHLKRLIEQQSNAIVEVIIGFDDGVTIPAMPRQFGNEPVDSAVNAASRARTQALIDGVMARREAKNVVRRERLGRELDVEFIETFWLTGAWLARIPASRIDALAALPDVTSVEPTGIGLPPPAYRGRALINSDWFALTTNIHRPLSEVIVAVLDTGVRRTHSMFNNPTVIRIWRDCVNGTTNNCATGTNLNPADTNGHGTRTAGVISGNGGPLGGDYRGVATFSIDSYKVYLNNNLDEPAVLRAFNAAVAEGAWVIAAEMQHPSTFTGQIAAAAEAAFDAGVTVVAADGNNNVVTVVAAPANAHRVLGIGAVNSETGATQSYAVYGPTTDNRIKPDIQLPSEFLTTAGNQSDTDYDDFGGTSAATAWAAGAAALLHRWYCDSTTKCISLYDNTPNPYPGQNYAAMIQSGTLVPPFAAERGAGPVRLMGCYGWDTFGWVTLQNGQTTDIPIYLDPRGSYAAPADWQVGLWWPETAAQTHNRIGLYLRNTANTANLASSIHSTSVFQRARVAGTLANGTYYLRISGMSVTGSQKVFYSSRARQSTGCS